MTGPLQRFGLFPTFAALSLLLGATLLLSCTPETRAGHDLPRAAADLPAPRDGETSRTAILAGGCFWCVEAVFERLNGVTDVVSGYAGGTRATANYDHYSESNHAEVVKITYDPTKITYGELLRVLFTICDPTQKDGQNPDLGHQYRFAVFYENADQQRVAEAYIKQLTEAGVFDKPIVATVEATGEGFFAAEDYHQDFVAKHPDHPYVRRWSVPKIHKLEAKFPDLLKPQAKSGN